MSANIFDAEFYSALYPDLAAEGLTTEKQLYRHLLTFGLKEGRRFSPLVDLNFYRANNPDLTFLDNEELFKHLRKYGVAEGRLFFPLVDLDFYREKNPDLGNLNNEKLFNHLEKYGVAEGRRFSPYIDLDFYLANNPDVNEAFGRDFNQALRHLETFGFQEGRRFSPNFKYDAALNRFISADPTNVVIDWNAITLNAISTDRTAPPTAARTMAMVHTAIYDAVNAIAKTYSTYKIDAQPPANASPEAAAAAAAYRILVNIYPAQATTLNTALTSSLAEVPDGKGKNDGIALGYGVADQVLAFRSQDGSTIKVPYYPLANPGNWVPTPPGFQPTLLPQWPDIIPFALKSGSQFRPSGPPVLTSAEYAAEFNQVKELGRKDSTARTPDETEIALFWSDGAGTYTPPGHWNQIAEEASLRRGNTLLEDARLFALLNIALADAAIAAWDAKYAYNLWRPITAIQQADTDGNPETTANPTWDCLIGTPPFPEYVSGHSTFSGAADIILTSVFGENFSFSNSSLGLPGVLRSFDSFSHAANEAGMSRIYGGIHFMSANEDGLATGRALGHYVVQNFLIPAPQPLG